MLEFRNDLTDERHNFTLTLVFQRERRYLIISRLTLKSASRFRLSRKDLFNFLSQLLQNSRVFSEFGLKVDEAIVVRLVQPQVLTFITRDLSQQPVLIENVFDLIFRLQLSVNGLLSIYIVFAPISFRSHH
jgi:hypothetical protein